MMTHVYYEILRQTLLVTKPWRSFTVGLCHIGIILGAWDRNLCECMYIPKTAFSGALVQWLTQQPATPEVASSGIHAWKTFFRNPLLKIQYCGEVPWSS